MREYRPNPRPFAFAALFLLAVACVAALLSGCGAEASVEAEPDVCAVSDECVPVVVEELCAPVTECETHEVEEEEEAGYDDGTCDAKPVRDNECFRFQYINTPSGLRWWKVRYDCPEPR